MNVNSRLRAIATQMKAASHGTLQPAAAVEEPAGNGHVADKLPKVASPWMTTPQCAAYMQFPSLRAFYVWLQTAEGRKLPAGRRGSRTLMFHRDVVDGFLRGEFRAKQAVTRKRVNHVGHVAGGQR